MTDVMYLKLFLVLLAVLAYIGIVRHIRLLMITYYYDGKNINQLTAIVFLSAIWPVLLIAMIVVGGLVKLFTKKKE